jgi:hypothetical protein
MVKLIDPSSTEGGVISAGGAGSTIPKKSFTTRLGEKASSVWNVGKKVALGAAIAGGVALGAKKGYDTYKRSEGVRYKAPEAATTTAPTPKPPPKAPPIQDWKARAAAAAAQGAADKITGKTGVGGIIKEVGKAVVGKDETTKLAKKETKAFKKEMKKAQKAAKKGKTAAKPQPSSTYASGTGADTRVKKKGLLGKAKAKVSGKGKKKKK